MSLAKKCDRCGKLYEHWPISNQLGTHNAIKLIQTISSGERICERDTYDLCRECMADFKKFMKGDNNG